MPKKIICLICGKAFNISPSRIGIRKYCSRNCYKLARSKFYSGKNHSNFGKHWKIGSGKRIVRTGHKTGPLSEETKNRISKSNTGKICSDKQKLIVSKANKGKIVSSETKRKMRLEAIKRVEQQVGKYHPNYSKIACEYFKKFDEENNTKGRYAIYGGGEFYIEELGYWVDYINFDKKLIIEWDDEVHHYKNGKLIEKDIVKQQEIQNLFPEFEFRRIREKNSVMGA